MNYKYCDITHEIQITYIHYTDSTTSNDTSIYYTYFRMMYLIDLPFVKI